MAVPKDSKSIEDVSGFMDSSKEKRNKKRQRNELIITDEEDNDIAKLIGQYSANTKIMKSNPDTELAESRKKILDMENQRRQTRLVFSRVTK